MLGGQGADKLLGGAGHDHLNGNIGGDTVAGGGGNDTVIGAGGSDTLFGGGGKDVLNGGKGDDLLNGGKGDDVLNGGAGHDQFAFSRGFGNDTITHFAAANGEKMDLSGVVAISSFDDLVSQHLQTDADTGFALIVAGQNSILIDNVTVSQFGHGHDYSAGDFIF